jgi:hypothetical protein
MFCGSKRRMMMKHSIHWKYIMITFLLVLLSWGNSWAQMAKRLVPETTVKKELLKGHKNSPRLAEAFDYSHHSSRG